MAEIDVSELMTDPDFLDCFQLTRTVQTVDATGRTQPGSPTVSMQYGVIQPAGGRTLAMMPDLTNVSGVIDVYTKCRLEGPSDTTQADVITWRRRDYVVATVQNYGNWGAGYVHAVCTMRQLTAATPSNR